MNHATQLMAAQYQLILGSRGRLFSYLNSLNPEDFIKENSQFGHGGTVRNLLVHIANTYESWIIQKALGRKIEFTPFNSIDNLEKTISLFDGINLSLYTFIERFSINPLEQIILDVKGIQQRQTPLALFTHVTTHEFHHKGQILTLTRHLGYTPVDTDIIFFP